MCLYLSLFLGGMVAYTYNVALGRIRWKDCTFEAILVSIARSEAVLVSIASCAFRAILVSI